MFPTNALQAPVPDSQPRRPGALRRFYLSVWPPLPVWKRLNLSVLVVMVYAAACVAVQDYLKFIDVKLPDPASAGLLTLMNSIILGILLGFRNKESYERWWEARKLWGQLVNDSRNMSLKVKALNGVPAVEQGRAGRLVAGFAVSLRNHLRGAGTLQNVPGFENDPMSPAHVPLHLAGQMAATVRAWRRAGYITEFELLWLDPHVKALMDVSGACERIKNTPIPLSYRSLLRHGLVLYMLLTPWFVADEMHWMAIPVMGLLAYFLMGIELTAEDVEEPFGRDDDDLALSVYCDTIRKSVSEVFGLAMAPVPASVVMPGLRVPAPAGK